VRIARPLVELPERVDFSRSDANDWIAALEQQVATALVADAPSADLAALLTEIDIAIVEAEATAKAQHDKALDPIASPDAATAKQSMEAASFAVARLRALQPRLARRYEQACALEQLATWRSEYDELQARQDALADELRSSYPEICRHPGRFVRSHRRAR
jgi:hypothetical protein